MEISDAAVSRRARRGGEGFFRLSLSTPDDRLKLALERLAEFVAAS